MARIEIRIPDWLKRRVTDNYPNISHKIRDLLIKDLGPRPINKVTSIKRIGQRGGHLPKDEHISYQLRPAA